MRTFLCVMLLAALCGCTQQEVAKNFGGTVRETLPAGRSLVNITWKDDHLWVLTAQRPEGVRPQTYEFNERSSYGLLQGTVIIVER